MVINLFGSGKKRVQLNIEARYFYHRPVISLGSDCHPAHVLKTLHMRNQSFPFDWVYTVPHAGLEYVNDNIRNNFSKVIDKLGRNQWGEVGSEWYEESAFLHYNDLIENKKTQKTLKRRAERFVKLFQSRPCLFLHTFPAVELTSRERADRFISSVGTFHTLSLLPHTLLIYIRFEEESRDNNGYTDYLIKELQKIPFTRVCTYVRKTEEFGVWGDNRVYPGLLKKLGVKLKGALPKIYFTTAGEKAESEEQTVKSPAESEG